MKREQGSAGRILDQFFERIAKPSPEQVDLSRRNVLLRLGSESATVLVEPELAADRTREVYRSWRPLVAVVALAAVVAAIGIALKMRSHPGVDTHAVVAAVDGTLFRVSGGESRPVQAGQRIEGGTLIRSDGGSELTLADGSRIEMRSKSELAIEAADDGVRIRLHDGNVIITAAKQRTGHLYVQTKDLAVSVVGTVFFVNAEEAGSRVGVVEGEVHVQQGLTTQKLFPGDQIVSKSSMPSTLVAEEIAWSHSAPAHMAQLQRATVIAPLPVQFEAASVRPDPQPTGGGAALGPLVCQGIDGGDHIAVPPNNVFPSKAPLGRCVGRYVNLVSLIAAAYGVPTRNISGGPDWAGTAFGPLVAFQVEAKAERPEVTTHEQLRQMLQSLLADRFQLQLRRETKQAPGFAMVIAKSGLKLKEAMGEEEPLEIHTGNGGGARGEAPSSTPRVVITGKTSMNTFAAFFRRCPQMEGRLVVDKTGLTGNYDFNLTLNWIPGPPPVPGVPIKPTCSPEYDPPLLKAVEEQLGLHLESGLIVPEEFIVIEHAEKPEN